MKSKIISTLLVLFSVATFGTTHNISFANFAYSPNLVLITVGDTVTWSGDFTSHPLESTMVPVGAQAFSNSVGSSFNYVVSVSGDYTFHCTIHSSMTGTIKASTPSTGIGMNNSINEILIYPTAVHSFLKISIPTSSINLIAEVKNILGQTTMKAELSNGSITTLDLSNQNNGIYFIAIRNELDLVKVVRVVKE